MVNVVRFILLLTAGLLYVFNSLICNYRHAPETLEWWYLNFALEFLIHIIFIQAVIITSNRPVRLIGSIVFSWILTDIGTLMFDPETMNIETRTHADYQMIVLAILLSIITYKAQSLIYKLCSSQQWH